MVHGWSLGNFSKCKRKLGSILSQQINDVNRDVIYETLAINMANYKISDVLHEIVLGKTLHCSPGAPLSEV